MYQSNCLSSIISSHNSKEYSPAQSLSKRINELSSKITNYSLAYNGCTYDLKERYYVYIYLDPRYPGNYRYVCPSGQVLRFKYRPLYVGKGRGKRMFAHTKQAKKGGNSRKCRTIRKLYRLGLKPIRYRLIIDIAEALAFAYEIDIISGIGRLNKKLGPLLNETDGGEGASGRDNKFSLESRLKMSISQYERFALETNLQKKKRVTKRKKTLDKNPHIEVNRRINISKFYDDPIKREEHSQKTRDHHNSLTNKQKVQRSKRHKKTWELKSDAEKKLHSERTSFAGKCIWAGYTNEEYQERIEKLKASHNDDRKARQASSIKATLAKKTQEEKDLSTKKRLAATTPEQRSVAVFKAWETRRRNAALKQYGE